MNIKPLRRFGYALLIGAGLLSQVYAQSGGSNADLNSLLGPAPTPAAAASSNTTPASAQASSASSSSNATASNTDAAAASGDTGADKFHTAPTNGTKNATAAAVGPSTGSTAAATSADASASPKSAAVRSKETTGVASTTGPRRVKSRITEEIIVTAERRKQNLQDVAISVSAFSGPALDAKGINDVKDLQLITPGLEYDSMASYSIIFIRGVGSDAFQAGVNSSVATYIDDLYLPITFSSAQALGDVERIEVLKGPQGSLYGRNAVGGAIVVTLKPPTDYYSGSVLAQYGNYSDFKGKLSLSGPVPFTDHTLLFSLSTLYENHQAYTINANPGINPGKFHSYRNRGYRGVLQWKPIDGLTFTGSYYNLKAQDPDSVATDLHRTAPLFSALLTADTRPHYSGNTPNVGVFGRTKIYSLVAEQKLLPWFSTKFIYGHIRAISDIVFDYDSAPEPVLDISALPNTARSDSFETIFTSSPDGTPDWFEYVAGLYYSNTTKTGQYPVTVDALGTAIGLPLSAQFGGVGPLCAIYAGLGGDCATNSSSNQNPLVRAPLRSGLNNKAKAIYGKFTFHITDQLSTNIGFRASHEDERLLYSEVAAYLVLPGIPGVSQTITTPQLAVIDYRHRAQSNNALTPTVGLNFKLTPDILLYYTYSEAFLSGNYNGLNINNPPTQVKPESASANEIGFKTTLLPDRNLKLNGAIFNTDVTNAQVQTLSLTDGGVTALQNAGSYTVYGAELEANYFPIEGLVVSLSGTFLHGRYGDFIGQGFDRTTGLNNIFINFTGNHTVRTPTLSGTASVDYTFPFFFGLTAEAAADAYYNKGFYYDPLNSLSQKAYYIANARFGLYDPRTHIRITAYGKNLNNGVFFTNAYVQDFGDTVIYGAPRTFGVTLTWNFGSGS